MNAAASQGKAQVRAAKEKGGYKAGIAVAKKLAKGTTSVQAQ